MTKAHLFVAFAKLDFCPFPFSIVYISLFQIHVLSDKSLTLVPYTCWQQDASICIVLVLFPVTHVHFHGWPKLRPCLGLAVGFSKPQSWYSLFDANCIFLHCVSFVMQGWMKMPVNCKLAYDWLGAINFLSNHFWFRKHSAILETGNIYLCLIYFTFSFRCGNLSLSLMGTKQGPFLCSWRACIFGYTFSVYYILLPTYRLNTLFLFKTLIIQYVTFRELRFCY